MAELSEDISAVTWHTFLEVWGSGAALMMAVAAILLQILDVPVGGWPLRALWGLMVLGLAVWAWGWWQNRRFDRRLQDGREMLRREDDAGRRKHGIMSLEAEQEAINGVVGWLLDLPVDDRGLMLSTEAIAERAGVGAQEAGWVLERYFGMYPHTRRGNLWLLGELNRLAGGPFGYGDR